MGESERVSTEAYAGPRGAVYDAAVRRVPSGSSLRVPLTVERHESLDFAQKDRTWSHWLVGDPRMALEERLFSWITLANGLISVAGAPAMLGVPGGHWLAGLQLLAGALILGLYVLNRRYRLYRRLLLPLVVITAGFLFLNVLGNAGTNGGAHYYLPVSLVACLAVTTSRRQTWWVAGILLGTAMLLLWIERVQPGWVRDAPEADRWLDVAPNLIFAMGLTGAIVLLLTTTLNNERRRSDELLQAMLPAQVLQELRHEGRAQPRIVDDATVLFADIAGFTASTAELGPGRLLRALDEVFTAIDGIIAENRLEKIKTVGDAYLAVGGVTNAAPGHVARTVVAALQIQAWMETWRARQRRPQLAGWRLRIGIHRGPVVAGVVGEARPAFDVWGDTVNVASRHEFACAPGRVNVSAEVVPAIDDLFVLEDRGLVPIKGKPDAVMTYVDRIRPELADPEAVTRPGLGFEMRLSVRYRTGS